MLVNWPINHHKPKTNVDFGHGCLFRKLVGGWNQKGIAVLHPQFFQTIPDKCCPKRIPGSPHIFPTGHCLTEFDGSILTGHLHDEKKTWCQVSNVSNVEAYPLSPLILDGCWSGCKAAPHGGSTIPKEIAEPKNLGDSPCNGWVIGARLLPSIFDWKMIATIFRDMMWQYVGYNMGIEWGIG